MEQSEGDGTPGRIGMGREEVRPFFSRRGLDVAADTVRQLTFVALPDDGWTA